MERQYRGIGRALETVGTPTNPFWATVGICIEPGPLGSGFTYHRDQDAQGTRAEAGGHGGGVAGSDRVAEDCGEGSGPDRPGGSAGPGAGA